VEARFREAEVALTPTVGGAADGAPTALDACEAHRYELAGRLCEGLRVAVLGASDEDRLSSLARSAAAVTRIDPLPGASGPARPARQLENVEHEAIGVSELLDADLGTRFDALLILDPPVVEQHLADRGEEFTRLAAAGMKLLVCARNPVLATDSPQPDPDHGGQRLPSPGPHLAWLGELPGAVTLEQFAAEGSLIRLDEGADLDARLALAEHGESEYANYLITCVNFDDAEMGEARLELRVAPQYNRHLRSLERANLELRRANAALARDWLGKRDTASASILRRLRDAEAERDAVMESVSWRITAPLRAFKALVKPLIRARRRRRDATRRI
jgi:hypothetical protein